MVANREFALVFEMFFVYSVCWTIVDYKLSSVKFFFDSLPRLIKIRANSLIGA